MSQVKLYERIKCYLTRLPEVNYLTYELQYKMLPENIHLSYLPGEIPGNLPQVNAPR